MNTLLFLGLALSLSTLYITLVISGLYEVATICFVITLIMMYLVLSGYQNPLSSTYSSMFWLVFYTIALIGIGFGSYSFYGNVDIPNIKYAFALLVLTAFSTIGLYHASYIVSVLPNILTTYLSSITGVAIVLVFMSIISTTMSGNQSNGIITQLIMYIPCLINDIITYIKGELGITPRNIYILMFLEAILILFYIYIPKLIVSYEKHGLVPILPDCNFLNVFNALQPVSIPINQTDYSISLWVYINNNQNIRSEKTVFCYGQSHPRICVTDDAFRIYYNGKDYVSIPSTFQKWNYLVITYKQNVVDIFVNCVLIQSVQMSFLPSYYVGDGFTTGQEDGINGSVANISYHPKPLTLSQITHFYNVLQFSNPPIFT